MKCEAPSAQAVPARGTKRRKIVRKLVNKMYIDSGGGSLLNQVGLFYWKENISMVKS